MAWIVPAALSIFSAVSQNADNKAAQKNNENQQAAAEENAQKARAQALQTIAPFTQPGKGPFNNQQPKAPGPAMAAPGGGGSGIAALPQVNASSVMGQMSPPPQAPQQAPQGAPSSANGQPPQQGQLSPQMIQAFVQMLQKAMGGGQPPGAPGTQRAPMPIAQKPQTPPQGGMPQAV